MAKKTKQPTFDEVLQNLRAAQFDVEAAPAVAGAEGKTFRVGKYGCAAVIAPGTFGARPEGSGATTALGRLNPLGKLPVGKNPELPAAAIVGKAGVVLQGKIGHILDRGYQKFITNGDVTVAATAVHLKALHRFQEELREWTGNASLYNESLGSVSDEYMYDRVKGRELPEGERATPPWQLTKEATTRES
jgi:hypothetical protein